MRRAKATRMLLVLLGLSLLAGCAFMNRDNTPTLNLVEEHVIPDETVWKVVLFPVGFLAVVADAVVVHPIAMIPEAAGDTGEALWENFEWEEKYVTECAVLPWRVIGTPFVFTGTWIGRALFDIERRGAREKEREEEERTRRGAEEAVKAAQALLLSGRASEALDLAVGAYDEARDLGVTDKAKRRLVVVILEAAHESGRYEELLREDVLELLDDLPGETLELLETMQASESATARWTALLICVGPDDFDQESQGGRLLGEALADPEALIRYAAIGVLIENKEYVEDHLPALRRIAEADPEELIRARAKLALELAGQ